VKVQKDSKDLGERLIEMNFAALRPTSRRIYDLPRDHGNGLDATEFAE